MLNKWIEGTDQHSTADDFSTHDRTSTVTNIPKEYYDQPIPLTLR